MMWRPNLDLPRPNLRCMLKRIVQRGSALGLLLTLLSLVAATQTTGAVKGKIRTLNGEGIAGATVTARQGGQDIKSAKSGSKGDFLLSGLEGGTYNVVFDAPGYSTGIKYSVEIEPNKTKNLGDRLMLQVDRGSLVVVQGAVFFKDGTSVTGAEVVIARVNSDGSSKKIAASMTNIYGEFGFRQPEGAAKYRVTAKYKNSTASKEIDVDSAAVYRLAISLDISRGEK